MVAADWLLTVTKNTRGNYTGKERRKTTNQFEKQYMDTEKVDVGRPIIQGSRGLDSYSPKVTDDSFSYSCNCCGKIMARKDRMKEHIQTHFPRCEMCGVLCRDTPSLKVHISRFHRSAVQLELQKVEIHIQYNISFCLQILFGVIQRLSLGCCDRKSRSTNIWFR